MKKYCCMAIVALVAMASSGLHAQVVLSGQIRPRAEYRNGQGSPQKEDTVAAGFVSQRTRINLRYTAHRLTLYTSLQDVRVWGQDASSINRNTTDPFAGLMLHEAWGEISLIDTGKVVKNLTLKIGRQELVYDDVRLLGNLDWLQQARRHDAALVKFEHQGWTAHLGGAYNQNAERKANTIYNGVPSGYPASTNGMSAMYKSMQFLYLARKLPIGNASFLVFKDDFSKYHYADDDVQKVTPIYDRGVWSRVTLGSYFAGAVNPNINLSASAYYQGGKYRDGTSLNEYLLSLSAMFKVNDRLTFGPGVDITSGNNGTDPAKKNQRFDPLYGTPHKFWGFMDYFYVADGFGANGLVDYYVRSKFNAGNQLTLSLDVHQFVLPAAVNDESGNAMEKSLGTEIDLTFNYPMTKMITLEGGWSAMFSTDTMSSPKVKNVADAASFSTWAYLMLTIKPEFVLK